MTADEAVRQAEAEGLTLMKADNSNTGYKGVCFNNNCKAKPYQTKVQRGGKQVYLGYFATAEGAALCFARTPEGRAAALAAAAAPPPMTAEEAVRQAEAEGLTLLRADSNASGYLRVVFKSRGTTPYTKPYQAQVRRGGKQVSLGYFATAEEAALAYARESAAQAVSSRKRKAEPCAEPEEGQEGADEDDVEVVVLDAYELFQPELLDEPGRACGFD